MFLGHMTSMKLLAILEHKQLCFVALCKSGSTLLGMIEHLFPPVLDSLFDGCVQTQTRLGLANEPMELHGLEMINHECLLQHKLNQKGFILQTRAL